MLRIACMDDTASHTTDIDMVCPVDCHGATFIAN